MALLILVCLESVDSLLTRADHRTADKVPMGSLHEIVGPDGVLMIHLPRAGRSEFNQLNAAGIHPTLFLATDAQNATTEELNQGCISNVSKEATKCQKRVGDGCKHSAEQAIAESHRRALVAAQSRNATWTAIMEDDAIPVDPQNWDENFKDIWAQVPPQVGFVRLGWCTFGDAVEKRAFAAHANWHLVDRPAYSSQGSGAGMYYAGGCTTAYMVHREYISQVLSLFPCCAPVDTCYEWDLFYKPGNCRESIDGASVCWGQQHMMGIDVKSSSNSTVLFTGKTQSGVIAQDNRQGYSIRSRDIGAENQGKLNEHSDGEQ
jgi:hypothetical protein